MAKKSRQELLHDRALAIIIVGEDVELTVDDNRQVVKDSKGLAHFNHAGLALLHDVYGPDHFHTKAFSETLESWNVQDLSVRVGVIKAVDFHLQGGWYEATRALIAAELFDDFLEMAGHLLDEGYKEAAAVIAGTSLETHLKRLCVPLGVELFNPNNLPKKAEAINADLHKAGAYVLNEQKQITAWLGIRNDAAHGNYDKVIAGSVRLMIDGVRHFITIHP